MSSCSSAWYTPPSFCTLVWHCEPKPFHGRQSLPLLESVAGTGPPPRDAAKPPRACRLAPRAVYLRLSPLLHLGSLLLTHSLSVWSSIDAFNVVQPSPSQVRRPGGLGSRAACSAAGSCRNALRPIAAGCYLVLGRAQRMNSCPAGPLGSLDGQLLAAHLCVWGVFTTKPHNVLLPLSFVCCWQLTCV